jgi:hypothetical protein
VDLHLLLLLVLYREPNIFFGIQLIDELEERTPLQQSVTDLIFNCGQHLEKLGVVNLRIAQESS